MRQHITILCLAMLLTVWAAAPAAAQMVISHEMRPMCDELPEQGMARTYCNEYYDAKQEVMNSVIADAIASVSTNPGDESLLTKVAGDILELHNELHTLQVQLDDILPEWNSDLIMARDDEVEAIDVAAEYWALMIYLASMTFEDVMTMMDAVDDFDAKAEELKELAEGLAMDYQEAVNVLEGDFEPVIMDEVRSDFATSVFISKTLSYASENLAKDLDDVLETYDPETRFATEFDYVYSLRGDLPEDWDSLHGFLDEAGEDLDTMFEDALFMLNERKTVMDEGTIFDEFGEPFTSYGYLQLPSRCEEVYAELLEELNYFRE